MFIPFARSRTLECPSEINCKEKEEVMKRAKFALETFVGLRSEN
jgi:hypothetical protein